MEHIPEDADGEREACSSAEIPRLSRFREQLTSSHASTTSLEIIPTASVSSPYPVPVSPHIIEHLLHGHKARPRQRKCILARSPKLKSKVKAKFRNHSKVTSPPAVTISTGNRLETRSSLASLASSDRRRSLAIEKIYAHRLAKALGRKREKEEREKQEAKFKGTVWGYDPNAGRLMTHEARCTASHSAPHDRNPPDNGTEETPRVGCYIFRGARRYSHGSDEYGNEEIDNLGRRTGRRWM